MKKNYKKIHKEYGFTERFSLCYDSHNPQNVSIT